jgi:hypothetical protein
MFGMQHKGQFLVAHIDCFGGVQGPRLGFGHDHGDGFADMARFVRGQQNVRAGKNRAAAGGGELHVEFGLRNGIVRNGRKSIGRAIGAGEHAAHAGHCSGGGGIDRNDPRVRIWRTRHRRVDLTVEIEIVGEAPFAGDEPFVLFARQRFTDGAIQILRTSGVVHRSFSLWFSSLTRRV